MNASKTTPLVALVALLALVGCDQRDDAAVTPAPDTTATPPATGDPGAMSPGGTAATPPAGAASGMETTPPPMQGASPPAN